MAGNGEQYVAGPNGERRMKDAEIVVPVVVGTVAFFLGKKATETSTHKWTVYVRGQRGEDMSHVIKKVVFKLHHSFANHTRALEVQPYEVSETGWGEFEIQIEIFFSDDSREKPIEVFHKLRLYEADQSVTQSTKKPVVAETYDELVFSEPTEEFYRRVKAHRPGPAPQLSTLQYALNFSQQEDLRTISAARQRVANQSGKLARQLEGY